MKIVNGSLIVGVLSVSLLFASSVWAQAFTPDQLTSQVKSLNAQSEQSEKVFKAIDSELKTLKQRLEKLQHLGGNQAMIELLQRVDELSDELSQLNGRIEQQSHDLGNLKKRQRELYIDTDRRLRDLESRTKQQPTTTPGQTSDLPDVSVPSVDIVVDSPQTIDVPVVADKDSKTTENSTVNVTSSEEQQAYQATFDTLKEGRYTKAKTELKTFLSQYSDSSFAGNAQYWLGEAYYVTREFEQGIKEFEKVLSDYPDSLKIPDAMLKLGYTYYELMQYEKSKLLLQDLRKRYPKSTAFRLAGKRLERMSKEGH